MVALWKRVSTLLRENCEELLEWLCWFSKFKFDFESVTAEKVACERCIVVGVVPVPRLAPIVIILEYPLKSLDICLSDVSTELPDLSIAPNMELLTVVPLFPPLLCEFDLVFI
jgi:hypothetical protein